MDLLKHLFTGEKDAAALSQGENEALVELLLLAVYADNHLSLPETNLLNAEFDKLHWQSGTAIDFYLAGATARIRDIVEEPGQEAKFLSGIAKRLPSKKSRTTAIDLLDKLFESDGVAHAENIFASRVKAALAH